MKRQRRFAPRVRGMMAGAVALCLSLGTGWMQGARVAVFGPPDEAALVETALSQVPGTEVLERTNTPELRDELILSTETLLPLALQQGLAADSLFLLSPDPGAGTWTILLVDAVDGQELGRSIRLPQARLPEVAVQLLSESSSPSAPLEKPVVILESNDPAARAAGQAIRELLHGLGVKILDRAVTWQVLEERFAREAGLVVEEETLPPFPGAEIIISVEKSEAGAMEIKMLSPDGSVLRVFDWSPLDTDPEVLQRSLLPLLNQNQNAVSPYQQRIGIEALLPFYRGVNAFAAGDFLGALVEFQKAREANHRFAAAYQWEQRCYEALELSEFSQALGRWLQSGLEGRGVAAGDAITHREGLTFLGVQSTEPARSALAAYWERAAIRELAGPDLLLPESLEVWAREFDFTSAANGTLLPSDNASTDAASARIEWSSADGFTTRFTLRGVLSPGTITWTLADDLTGQIMARAPMPSDRFQGDAPALLQETLQALLQTKSQLENAETAAAPQLPSAEEAIRILQSSADQSRKMAAALALLLQEPQHPLIIGLRLGSAKGSDGVLGDYLDHAKREVLLRLLPLDDPQRPWVELQSIQTFLPSFASGRHLSGQDRDGLAELKSFADAHPEHPAGALAHFFWLTDSQALLRGCEKSSERVRCKIFLRWARRERGGHPLCGLALASNTDHRKKGCNPCWGESRLGGLAALAARLQPTEGMRRRGRLAIPPNLLSRTHSILFSQPLSPQEVIEEARQLADRMARVKGIPGGHDLRGMAQSMEWLGRAAAGEGGLVLDPKQVTPRPFLLEIEPDGKKRLGYPESWGVQDFRKFNLTSEEIQIEALAALTIGGRSARRKMVEPEWLERFGDTFSLASWIGWICLHEYSHVDGLPHAQTGNYEAWKKHRSEMLRVAVHGLSKWMDRVENEAQFRAVDAPIYWMVASLGAPAYDLQEEEFTALHGKLTAAASRAAKRLGVPDRSPRPYGLYQLDWRDVTLEEIHRQGADELNGPPNFVRDIPAFLRALRERGQEAFVADLPEIRGWWEQTNWGLDSSISNRELATTLVLPFYQDILHTYGSGPLSDNERALLLDTGILLMWGWRYAEAEQLFDLVVQADPAATSVEDVRHALQGSALFHLARLQIQAKNKPAAMRMLHEVLAKTSQLEVRLLLRMHRDFRRDLLHAPGQRENLRSLAMRLLEELRFDPALAKLPERTFALRIPTTQLENPEVTVFYRLPTAVAADAPLLIYLPSFNHGGLELLEEQSPWIRWADENGVVLIVPQFFQNHTVWKADHPCAPYHFPQLWAGDALLQAAHQIRSRHDIETEKLFFHGRGAGAQCAARFARWKPELVAGLSLHSAAAFPWREREVGLQPPAVYQGMPILLTTGIDEDHGRSSNARRFNAEVFATVLQGAGADMDFHLLDSTFHRPAPEEQTLAQTFFTNQIQKTKP